MPAAVIVKEFYAESNPVVNEVTVAYGAAKSKVHVFEHFDSEDAAKITTTAMPVAESVS